MGEPSNIDWDDAEWDEPPEGGFSEDPFEPPIPLPEQGPFWLAPGAWLTAEQRSARALARAAEAVGRLDERLHRAPDWQREGWLARLATAEVSALLWSEGQRLRPEALALADAGRIGRSGDEDAVVARGQWARRRLMGQGALPADEAGIYAFLGRVGQGEAREADPWADLPSSLIPAGPDRSGGGQWLTAMTALEEAHPLTQSAAAFHLWRGLGLCQPTDWLEPGVLACRIAMREGRGMSAAPIGVGIPATRPAEPGDAVARLKGWLSGLIQAAGHAQLSLDRIEAWRARADAQTAEMQGKGARALIGVLASRPIVSARDVAGALGVSTVQARLLLNRFEARGLVRELTGHSRFRFWEAAV